MEKAHVAMVNTVRIFWDKSTAGGVSVADQEILLLNLLIWCVDYREQLKELRVFDEALHDVESNLHKILMSIF